MKKVLGILLLAVLVSPLASFAETDVAAEVNAKTNLPAKTSGGLVGKIKTKIAPKKKEKKLEAKALTAEQITCISNAMNTRDTAQDTAETDAVKMISDARWARNEDMIAALSLSGDARIAANKQARTDFRGMVMKTGDWKRKAMNMAADAYRTTVQNTCKVTSPDQLVVEPEPSESSTVSAS